MATTAKSKFTCNIISAYAPIRKSIKDLEQAIKFYNQLSFIVNRTTNLELIIIGRYFNANP